MGGLVLLGGRRALFLPAALKYFFGLLLYYTALFVLVRRLMRSSSLASAWKRGGVAGLLVLLALVAVVVPGELSLETIKNFTVLSVPVLLGWLVPVASRARATTATEAEWPTLAGVVRDIVPFLVSDAAYLMLHDLVHRINPVDRDGWLLAADERLFGGHATKWLEPYVHPVLTEWFSATYSLFVFFPLTLALWFVARGQRAALRHLLLAVILCNYLGYLGYLAVPAIGPMYTLTYDLPLSGGWFYQIKESLDQLARVPRDCFPSLHTANTFVVLLIVWRYARPLSALYFALGMSCIAATIYLRYHYTIDVVVGLILGGVVTRAAPALAGAWEAAVSRMAPVGPDRQAPQGV